MEGSYMPWRDLKEDLEHVRKEDTEKALAARRQTTQAQQGVLETEYDESKPGPRLARHKEEVASLQGILDTEKAEKRKHRYILENAEDVEKEIEALAKRHNTLVSLRITERPLKSIKTSSFVAFFGSLADVVIEGVNSLRGMPDEEELVSLINDVKVVATKKVRESDQERIDIMTTDLKAAVDDLAEAMQLVPRLIQLDSALTSRPFDNHDAIQSALLKIYDSYERKGRYAYFKSLGYKQEHALNKDRWDKYYNGLVSDLRHLPKLKPFFERRQNIIQTAQTEAELFEVEDPATLSNEEELRKKDKLTSMSQYIDKNFSFIDNGTSPATKSFSRRYTKLDEMVARLKSERRARIDRVKREAEDLFDETKQQFVEWKRQLENFQQALSDPQKGLTFPWKIFPPSRIDVEEARIKVQSYKEKFRDWPSATLIFDDKCMALEGHDFILDRMKSYGQRLIGDALDHQKYKKENGRELPYQTLQKWVNSYKTFLFKTMIREKECVDTFSKQQYEIDPEAKRLIDNMEQKLFFYAHRQIKKMQWFSFLRHTFWKPKPERQAGWSDIITHANGGNQKKGFTGKRTRDTLAMLGWLKKDDVLNTKPDESPEYFISEWHLQCEAKRNATSSFTGKTTITA